MSRVLVIPDLHLPVEHKHAIDFCVDVYNQYECDKVVFIGDIMDNHAISFHAKHPNCPSAVDEFYQVMTSLRQWYDTFPVADVMIGNHDERVHRLAESVNIPSKYLKPYAEMWDTPEWNWVFETIIDGVYYYHGNKAGGNTPGLKKAMKIGMPVVMGHRHSVAGIHYNATPMCLYWGLDVGCLIDRKAWQFEYGKHIDNKPILGCGVVDDGFEGQFVPMKMEKYK